MGGGGSRWRLQGRVLLASVSFRVAAPLVSPGCDRALQLRLVVTRALPVALHGAPSLRLTSSSYWVRAPPWHRPHTCGSLRSKEVTFTAKEPRLDTLWEGKGSAHTDTKQDLGSSKAADHKCRA